jgi:hypothetical protein
MILQVPIELANQIIGYLGTKPYQEVYQLIDGLKEAAKPPAVPTRDAGESQNG